MHHKPAREVNKFRMTIPPTKKIPFTKKAMLALSAVGPGLFLIGYNIGTGSVTTMAKTGAEHGMQLFWALALSCLFTYFLMVAYGQVTLVTGQTALWSLRQRFTSYHLGKILALYILIALILGELMALMGIMGIVADLLQEGSRIALGTEVSTFWITAVLAVGIYALLWNGSYAVFEKFLITFVILMGSIDLSVGAIVLLSGAVTVKVLNIEDIGAAAVLVGLFTGMVLGYANGVIFALGRIPSFVVTLGTLSVFTGGAWEILNGRALRYDSLPFEDLAIGQLIPRFPNIALIALGVWVVMVFLCFATRFGRYMYIIGGGEAVAATAGIPVRRYKIYGFMLSGAMAGLAGSLAVARLGTAGPTLGQDLLLNTLAAIVVGGTSLSGGIGGVHRTLIGVLIIVLLDNGLNLMGVNQYTQMMVKGGVVIAAVLISQDRAKASVVK